jgi:uncharacterized protein
MIALIERRQHAIHDLCRQHRARRLELFGSATSADAFDSDTSDLDFLVEFEPLTPAERADSYPGLLFALEALFNRPVDLVESDAIRNPYFLRAIAPTRQVLYEAADSNTPTLRAMRRDPRRVLNIIGIGASAEPSDIQHNKDAYLADAIDPRQ